MDLVETARALDVFVSAIRLDWDANIGTTDVKIEYCYGDTEKLELNLFLSALR